MYVQRRKSCYLKLKHKNIDQVNLIKIVETLVTQLNIAYTFRLIVWDERVTIIFNQLRNQCQTKRVSTVGEEAHTPPFSRSTPLF